MRVTVEFSEHDLKDICRFTGEAKKGSAVRKLLASALMMKRREHIAQKFISGEWGVEYRGLEEARAKDREKDALRSNSSADFVLQETRQTKAALSASYGHDVKQLFAEARNRQKKSGRSAVSLQTKPKK